MSDERREMHEALKVLLPRERPIWSRTGIYAYWDPGGRTLLYLGLARDLPTRFAQHNGVVSHQGGNKHANVNGWFSAHLRLGVTVMLQSAAVELMRMINAINPLHGINPDAMIKLAEGQLIELARKETGEWPPWNRASGAGRGARLAQPTERSFIPLLAAARDSLFVARRSLRDLAGDDEAQRYETAIHTARMRAVMESHDIVGFPPSRSEVSHRIKQLLLVNSGHLIDDLAPSDTHLMEWLRRLQDGRADLERRATLADAEELEHVSPDNRLINRLIRGMLAEGDMRDEAHVVDELMDCDYLMQVPRL
jgi:hypothetical protein